jgi:hypothetical protein
VNSGPRPCLIDVGFPLSGSQDRTSTSDLKRHAQHTALNVKLKREGKPVDAIRLARLEGDPTGQDVVPAQLEQSQSTLSRAPETRAQ